MNKGKREELRRVHKALVAHDHRESGSRAKLETLAASIPTLLDALDEAEDENSYYIQLTDALRKLDEAERKLAEAEKEVEQRFEFLNEVNESSRP